MMSKIRIMYQVEEIRSDGSERVVARRMVKVEHRPLIEPIIISLAIEEAQTIALCAAWPALLYLDAHGEKQTMMHIHGAARAVVTSMRHVLSHMVKPLCHAGTEKDVCVETVTSSPQIYYDDEGITVKWEHSFKMFSRDALIANHAQKKEPSPEQTELFNEVKP
jgi:hypothetical protein